MNGFGATATACQGRVLADPTIRAELDEDGPTVVTEVNPELVIFFESRARGDARRNSDLALVVVESQPFRSGRSTDGEEVRQLQAGVRGDADADVVVCSDDNSDYWNGILNHVLTHAVGQSAVVYARR